MENLYLSLDEARAQLNRRWNDLPLKKKVEDVLGQRFISYYQTNPRAITFRQLVSGDNGLTFFYYCSRYIGAQATVKEFLDDIFVSLNEEKKGLGRLRVTVEDGRNAIIDIMDFHSNEKMRLRDCTTITGESLVDFHHTLVSLDGHHVEIKDTTEWFLSIGKASDYYYYMLLHFLAHGVLFEFFYEESDTREDIFTNEIVYPAIKRIQDEFGLTPMIVRAYPTHQTDEEDFFWWNHSKIVNNYIVSYAKKNNLNIKIV